MKGAVTTGFGARLASAREARGLTIAEVAERLKLSPRQVEALEAEDWTNLPDAVFVRGFVRNYAKIVGIEPGELLPSLDAVDTVTQTITAPSAGVRLGGSPVARWLLLPIVLTVLFVTGVVGLYSWLKQGEEVLLPQTTVTAQTTPDHTTAAREPVQQNVPISQGAEGSEVTLPPSATTPSQSLASGEMPSAVPQPISPALPQTMSPSGATDEQASIQPPPSQPRAPVSMRFEPSEDAWIQVVDAKGMRFSKLVRGGAVEVVSGTPPFRLVVGNAAKVNLTYNGHVIDLKPYIGEKVARLTLD